MGSKFLAAVVVACGLMGCGGGGGGTGSGFLGDQTLYVSLYYPSEPIPLLHPSVVRPEGSGFDGHSPRCSLVSGAVPPGMVLTSTCAVEGRPTLPGDYSFVMRFGASGVDNTLDKGVTLKVRGPRFVYPRRTFNDLLRPGMVVSDAPQMMDWTPPADVPATWRFELRSGTLPPGLAVDETTGTIAGVVQSEGSHAGTVHPTLITPFGEYALESFSYVADVGRVQFGYLLEMGEERKTAYIGRPFSIEPWSPAFDPAVLSSVAVTEGTLPAGLLVDPATGRIAGIATGPTVSMLLLRLEATAVRSGVASTASGFLVLDVRRPVHVGYEQSFVALDRGMAVHLPPLVQQFTTLAGDTTYSASPYGFCNLPPGTALDGNGVITGTPSAAGDYSCNVEFTIADNSLTWTTSSSISMHVR